MARKILNRLLKDTKPPDSFLHRVFYRLWQFVQVITAKVNHEQWLNATSKLDPEIRNQLNKLRRPEKAHILRVYSDIKCDLHLSEYEKQNLLELALLHDIGKSITKPTLLYKVAKVIFSVSNTRHCIEGAKFLKKLGKNKKVIIRVLRHHQLNSNDPLIKKFQLYDDRN